MNRKQILEKLEDLARQAGELDDSLDLAACLRVFIAGATKEDSFLLKFMKVYSHLYHSEEDREIWNKMRQKSIKAKDREIALQIRGFLLNSVRMSPQEEEFSRIKKEVMSDPPSYDSFLKLLERGGLPVSEMKAFQMKELVESHMKYRSSAH